ncbi:hypothetical protein CAPTEDRAFT_213677 [Capitella teleta]|uniref:Uncharacterized protein n=1 Tax=Capitella teleta TaxID=283909 RepID=R7VF22_CAPTE|nr:hypothetical protein CAPTEDRAFT_213677 [Capitella teleta]|eukprot:ELU14911.1 hypothetical protein CAPTEDRAFT_213677 [Capitella teleta]
MCIHLNGVFLVRPCRKYLCAILNFPTLKDITDARSWFRPHQSESRYVPVEGEALTVANALDKARYFVLGCEDLIIAVYHKPLLEIFGDQQLEDIFATDKAEMLTLSEDVAAIKMDKDSFYPTTSILIGLHTASQSIDGIEEDTISAASFPINFLSVKS